MNFVGIFLWSWSKKNLQGYEPQAKKKYYFLEVFKVRSQPSDTMPSEKLYANMYIFRSACVVLTAHAYVLRT